MRRVLRCGGSRRVELRPNSKFICLGTTNLVHALRIEMDLEVFILQYQEDRCRRVLKNKERSEKFYENLFLSGRFFLKPP